MKGELSPLYRSIYRTVRNIPPGRVATYGGIARAAGIPGQARLVGYALHRCPEHMQIPWQRVVNAAGELSRLPDPDASQRQRDLLEREGIVFDPHGRIDLKQYGWINGV